MAGHLRSVAGGRGEGARPLRVVLAERHLPTRRTLRSVLAGEGGIEVIGEAGCVESLLRALRRTPHVLALDRALTGAAGFAVLETVLVAAPTVAVVLMTLDDNRRHAAEALRVGATAVVLKEMADHDLPAAIRSAAAGKPFLSPRIAS